MHWKSGSHGLNLQSACHVLVHLSPVWSADGWTQTIGRIHRRGQRHKCTRYVLATEGTVEGVMLSRVGGKADDEETFMRALQG
jgi:SNF2 family DNA or RNA helicase